MSQRAERRLQMPDGMNHPWVNVAIVFCATACVLALGCSHEGPPAAATTTAGAAGIASERAVRRLTNVRCDRAITCNEVGDKEKKYTDDLACRDENQRDLETDLGGSECPHGVRQETLASCAEAIRNESCGNVLDKISRLATCRTSSLCID